jgi:hypothetical protein
MNKYLKKHDDGQVDWSKVGFEMLNEFQDLMMGGLDLSCRRLLHEVLVARGFEINDIYSEYFISDGEGRIVFVLMDDEFLKVVRDEVIYNLPMHYASGSDELCDLWEMIRKAWNADAS